MEYVLKLRTGGDQLAKEIEQALREEYDLNASVTPAPGHLTVPGLDVQVHAFNFRDNTYGDCVVGLAVGYDGKFRVYTHLTKYCPKCNMLTEQSGQFCSECGTKLHYRLL